jgi:spore coat protein JB
MNNYRDYYNYANNNYNLPLYNQDKSYHKLYEPYQGLIRGNMFPDLYNTYKVSAPIEILPENEQARLLTSIDSLEFALIDLSLYLDIYPDNEYMLKQFNMVRTNMNELVYEYQKKYGPLCLNNDALNKYPYAWIKSPWPWEGDNNVEI